MANREAFVSLIEHIIFAEYFDTKDAEILILTFPLYEKRTNLIHLLIHYEEDTEQHHHHCTKKQCISTFINKRKRIAQFFAFWTKIDKEKKLGQIVLRFLESTNSPEFEMDLTRIREQLSIIDIPPPPPSLKLHSQKNRHGLFMGYKLLKVGQALTMIDWEFFKQIKAKHLLKKSWQGENREIQAPGMAALANRFVKMSNWVATQILLGKTVETQSSILSQFIKLLKILLSIRNHETALQILCGLNMSSIQRMKHLWEKISCQRKTEFNEIDKLFSPVDNYANYRDFLAKQEKDNSPCLPYLALFLRDIIYIFDGNEEFNEDKSINFERMKLLASQVQNLQKYQEIPFGFDNIPNPLSKFVTRLWPAKTEEELYELSIQQRPVAFTEQPEFTDDELILSLTEILNEPLLCNGFLKFLTKHKCAEYLHFVRDVDKLASIPITQEYEFQKCIEKIIYLYILPTASLFVDGLEENERNKIISQFDNQESEQEMFTKSRDAAFKYLQKEYLSDFLRDHAYRSSLLVTQSLWRRVNPEFKEEEIIKSMIGETCGLSDSQWHSFVEHVNVLKIKKGEFLPNQQGFCSCIFRVEKGVFVSNSESQKRKTFTKGCIIGETNIFQPTPFVDAITAIQDSQVSKIDVNTLKKKFIANPTMGLLYYQNAGIRLIEARSKILMHNPIQARIRKSGRKVNVNSKDSVSVMRRFALPQTEIVIGDYDCQVIFNSLIIRPGILFITRNFICYESKIFGRRKLESFKGDSLQNISVVITKKMIKLKFQNTRTKRFILSLHDLSEFTDKVELLKKNNKYRREVGLDGMYRMKSLSMQEDVMELTMEDWNTIASCQPSSIIFQPGDIIVEQGRIYDMTGQIVMGTARVEKQDLDFNISNIVDNLGPGDIFGEITFLSGEPAKISIIAQEELEVYVTTTAMLKLLFKTSPLVVLKFYHYLCVLVCKKSKENGDVKRIRHSSISVAYSTRNYI